MVLESGFAYITLVIGRHREKVMLVRVRSPGPLSAPRHTDVERPLPEDLKGRKEARAADGFQVTCSHSERS